MTAEVAILNRSAVALAADSAVTLSGPNASDGVDKIFQNENKLFELSKVHPVGIMIYNATMLFEIPWEVIIKDFRTDSGTTSRPHVFEWAQAFVDYVVRHSVFKPDALRQRQFFPTILDEELNYILLDWSTAAQPIFFPNRQKLIGVDIPLL